MSEQAYVRIAENVDIRECKNAFPVGACIFIGCGICTITCPTDALKLHRYERPTRPFDTLLEFGITVARDNDRLPRQD